MPILDFGDIPSSDPIEPDDDAFRSGPPSSTPQSPSRTRSSSPSTDVLVLPPRLAGHKRGSASQDLSQYAVSVARRVRLKVSDSQELATLTQLTDGERSLYLAAKLLKIQESLSMIQPADSVYVMPRTLTNYVDRYTFSFLLSPTLAKYVAKGQLTNLVLDMLEKNPSSGWPADANTSKVKMDTIRNRTQTKLTERRNQIKEVLCNSLGKPALGETEKDDTKLMAPRLDAMNIIDLCAAVLAIYKPVKLSVTIQMCSRMAVLREVLMSGNPELKSPSYWPDVDKALESVRTQYPNDAVKRSKIFAKILNNDRRLYGHADVDSLQAVSPTATQTEADQHIRGEAVTNFVRSDGANDVGEDE